MAFHFFQSWIAFVFNRILPFHGLLFRIAALTTRRFARIPSSRNEWRHEKDLDFVCSKTKHKKSHKIDDPIKKWRFVGVSFSHTFFFHFTAARKANDDDDSKRANFFFVIKTNAITFDAIGSALPRSQSRSTLK